MLPVHLFKEYQPFLALLDEHGIRYHERKPPVGAIRASSWVIEILDQAGIYASLAVVVSAWLKSRRSRKVIITTKDGTVIHAEGLSQDELASFLAQAKNLAAFDLGERSLDPPKGDR